MTREPEEADVWTIGALAMAALVVLVLAFALAGCTSAQPAVVTANAVRLAGHAGVEPLRTLCREPAEAAERLPEAEAQVEALRLRRLGCPEAARAHVALVAAHETLHAAAELHQAGRCVGVSTSAADCDVLGAASLLVRASADFAHAIDAVRREASR